MARSALPMALIGAALAGVAATPHAPDAVCPPADQPMDPARYLRSLSLDLRGYAPALSEYELIDEVEVEDALDVVVDDWLASDDFADRVVRHHQALLWNNITNVRLTSNRFILSQTGGLHYIRSKALALRGDVVPCLDEPAQYDDDGTIVMTSQADGTIREGYVWVNPYWAPETTLKVCALDAQTRAVASSGEACDRREAGDEAECGCGPDLNWCGYGRYTDEVVLASLGEDIQRRIADVISSDQSYLTLFDGRSAWVNGPIVHYLNHQIGVYQNTTMEPSGYRMQALPDLHYTDVDTWVEVELDGQHAGLLTSPAFLMRFQTNRARANRFYNAFLCEPFQPPTEGLPAPDESKVPPLDLQVRDGCKYCHAQLEPAAAYWGRWTPSGSGWLDPGKFPPVRDDCLACAEGSGNCSIECRTHYLTDTLGEEQEPWLGWLNSYEFRRDEHMGNIEAGPRVLAASSVVDGRLPACVAKRREGLHAERRSFCARSAMSWASRSSSSRRARRRCGVRPPMRQGDRTSLRCRAAS